MMCKEVELFKEVLKKNGVPCRQAPRTKEELADLICVYNTKNETFEIKHKDYVLTENEVLVPIEGLYEKYKSSNTTEKTNMSNCKKEIELTM